MLYAQRGVDPEPMIGFACSVSGERSESVQKFSQLLAKQKYQKISNF